MLSKYQTYTPFYNIAHHGNDCIDIDDTKRLLGNRIYLDIMENIEGFIIDSKPMLITISESKDFNQVTYKMTFDYHLDGIASTFVAEIKETIPVFIREEDKALYMTFIKCRLVRYLAIKIVDRLFPVFVDHLKENYYPPKLKE